MPLDIGYIRSFSFGWTEENDWYSKGRLIFSWLYWKSVHSEHI
jgi:hypothetical protein